MTTTEHLGHAALSGWREKVADKVAPPVASRAPVSEQQARAIVGASFFALSVFYVASSIARMVKAARD